MVLADVRWTLNGPPGRPVYEAGHLPGAVYVDLESELTTHGPVGGRHPLPDPDVFQRAMRRIGVSATTPVVVYDGATSLAASRLWWLLTDAGHPDVRVLDGGYAAWQAAGRPVETGPGPTPTVGDFVVESGHRRVLDAGAVAALIRSGTGQRLVDVRAADRYAGENETIDPIAGHIPGAVNRPSMANLTESGRFTAGRGDRAGLCRPGGGAGALLRLGHHRRAHPAGPRDGRPHRLDLPRLVERLDHRPGPPARHRSDPLGTPPSVRRGSLLLRTAEHDLVPAGHGRALAARGLGWGGGGRLVRDVEGEQLLLRLGRRRPVHLGAVASLPALVTGSSGASSSVGVSPNRTVSTNDAASSRRSSRATAGSGRPGSSLPSGTSTSPSERSSLGSTG